MSLPTKVNVARPEAWGYDALIEYGPTDADSLYLRLAVGPGRTMSFQTVTEVEQGVDVADTPEDLRGESGQSFSRSDFSGGEGLDRAHRRGGTDRDWSRYWASRNLRVIPSQAGASAEIQLARTDELIRSPNGTYFRPLVITSTRILYAVVTAVGAPSAIDRSAIPTASSPSWTTEDPGGSDDIFDLAVLGSVVYAARETGGIRQRNGSWAAWSDLKARRIWGVKGRIIAFDWAETGLYEARSGAGSVLIQSSTATWTDVIDAGDHILAASRDGNIYSFTDEAGTLVLVSQTRLEGEVPFSLAYTQGLVFVGTGTDATAQSGVGRLWRALLIGGRLREGQVIRKWSKIGSVPTALVATRDSVYTAVLNHASGDLGDLWRYDLTTGGMFSEVGSNTVVQGIDAMAAVWDTAYLDDEPVVFWCDISGLSRHDETYATSGYLISALADFFNAGKKTWVGARLDADLPTGTQVVLAYSTNPAAIEDPDHASWTDVITATPSSPGDSTEFPITNVESRYIAAKLTLTPNGAATATPTVRSFALRGLPLDAEIDYVLPVNVSDRLELPNRKPLNVARGRIGDAVYEKLQAIRGKAVTVTLLRPDEVVKGQLRSVTVPIPELPRRGSPSVYAQVIIRGQKQ